jgi:hypothetical protein
MVIITVACLKYEDHLVFLHTVFEFWFRRQKIGVTRFAYDSNDNQRSPKTQSALLLDYGDSCTVVVMIEP